MRQLASSKRSALPDAGGIRWHSFWLLTEFGSIHPSKKVPSDVWAVVPFSPQVTGQRWTAFWKAAATRGYHSMFGAYDSKAHSTSSHKENLLAISCVINLFLAVQAPSPLLLRLLPDILGLKHCTAVLSTVLWSTQQHSHLQRIHTRDNVHQTRDRTCKQTSESESSQYEGWYVGGLTVFKCPITMLYTWN